MTRRRTRAADWKVDGQGAATNTHDRQVAQHSSKLRSHLQRLIDAHEIEHDLGTLPVRHPHDARDRRISRQQASVRAHLQGGLEFLIRRVHGNNLRRRGERAEHLDCHLPEPARSDHHRRGTRPKQIQRALDRVIAGESRVTQWGGLPRVKAPERNQEARGRDEQILRHAAIV